MLNSKVQHVLVLNGWSASSSIWDDFLAQGFESCSVEVLSLTESFSSEQWSAQIDSRIKPGTVLIAWSLGGALALNYLTNYQVLGSHKQNILGAVFLQATPCFVNSELWQSGVSQEDFNSLYSLLEADDLSNLVRRFTFLLLAGSQYRKQDKALLASCYKVESLPAQEVLKQGLDLLKTFDLRESLTRLTLPSLWLLGENDSLISPDVDAYRSLLSKLPDDAVQVIDHMGHFPCGQHAAEVKTHIVQFLGGL